MVQESELFRFSSTPQLIHFLPNTYFPWWVNLIHQMPCVQERGACFALPFWVQKSPLPRKVSLATWFCSTNSRTETNRTHRRTEQKETCDYYNCTNFIVLCFFWFYVKASLFQKAIWSQFPGRSKWLETVDTITLHISSPNIFVSLMIVLI